MYAALGIVLCLLVAPSALAATVLQMPWPRPLGLADGLIPTDIRAINQDATGYLWLASSDGLVRFDGQRFRTLGLEEGLPDTDLRGVHVDPRDRLWLATATQGVVMLGVDRTTFERAPAAAPIAVRSGHIRQVTGGRDGRIWVIGDDQRLYARPGDQPVWRVQALGEEAITSVVVDRDGAVWAASDTAVWRWMGSAFQRVPLPEAVSSPLRSLWADPRGGVEVATADHRWALDAGGRRIAGPHPGRTLLRGTDGVVWQQAGDALQWQHHGQIRPVGLRPDRAAAAAPVRIRQMLQDRRGDIWWVSEYHGVWWLPSQWRRFTAVPVMGPAQREPDLQPVVGLAVSGRDHVWVASADGALQRLDLRTGLAVPVPGVAAPPAAAASIGVAEDAAGRVWWAGGGQLVRYDPASQRVQQWPLGTASSSTMDLQVCAHGEVWLADTAAVHRWSPADERIRSAPLAALGLRAGGGARQLLCTGDGSVWATDPAGLMRWMPTRHRFERVADGGGGATTALVEAGDGSVWVARHAAVEHYRVRPAGVARLQRISTDDGYPQLRAGALTVEPGGVLWAGTPRGLVRVDPRHREVTLLGVAQGLPVQEVLPQRLLRLGSGALVAAVREGGLLAFDPSLPPAPPSVPVLVVDAMTRRRHDRAMAIPLGAGPVALSTADRNIRVAVSLLGRGDPDHIRHRFRLLGQDDAWIDTGPVAQRIFARLPAGEHVLLIQARHATGPWSAVRELRLRVVPGGWQSTPARLALVAVGIAGVVLLGRLMHGYQRRREGRRTVRGDRDQAELDSLERTRFLARLGRQIRTPMTPVLGWSEIMLQSTLSPTQRTQVGSLHQAGHHLLQLMDDALDLASIEGDRLQLTNAPFELSALLDELHALLLPVAQTKAIALQWSDTLPPGLHHLGDVQRLRQILLNLLGNALKFTARGRVSLMARTGAAGHGLELCIADTGPGMSAQQVACLFQRFAQAEGAHTLARHGGSGLGLAISRELAQAMGGDIEVDSEPGRGTRLSVHLPWPAVPSAQSAAMQAAARRHTGSLRVMVLLPSASVTDVVCALLRSGGHRVLGVDDIDTWLRHADPGPWDLIAADPDMLVGGERASARLPWLWPGVTRLALSPRADANAERDALAAGFDLFLRLPLTGAHLDAALARCIVST